MNKELIIFIFQFYEILGSNQLTSIGKEPLIGPYKVWLMRRKLTTSYIVITTSFLFLMDRLHPSNV